MGGYVGNGAQKSTIFVQSPPLLPAEYEYSKFAHELEHALETNNRLSGIWKRKTLPIKMLFQKLRLGSKNFEQLQHLGQRTSSGFQVELQKANNTLLGQGNPILSITPTTEGLISLNGKTEGRYFAGIRKILNHYVNGKVKGSKNNEILSHLRRVMDSEIPAYTVDGKVLEYAQGIKAGQCSVSTGTAVLYRDAQKVLQQEQKLYWFNRLFGKLRRPTVFHTQDDLINLGRTAEEKEIIKNIAKAINVDKQQAFFATLKSRPDVLKNIQAFRNASMVNGASLYDDCLSAIVDLNPKMLENSDFVKVLKLQSPTFGYPVYSDALSVLEKASPDKLKRFASIADEIIMLDERAVFKYECLAKHIDNPSYNKLKQLADIEVNGTYPYHYIIEDMPRYLSLNQIDDLCQEAISAKKNGLDIMPKIVQQIDDAACSQLGIKQCTAPSIDISDLKIKSV